MNKFHSLEIDKNKIAVLILQIKNSESDTLSSKWLIEELTGTFQQIHTMKNICGLLIKIDTEKKSIEQFCFSDLLTFKNDIDVIDQAHAGQELTELIETLPFPSAMIVNQPCINHELELALACTFRVAEEKKDIVFGFPEVGWGVIPTWGATQRLPKLIGLSHSIDLLAKGQIWNVSKALQLGLVHKVIHPSFLEVVAKKMLLEETMNSYSDMKLDQDFAWSRKLLEKIPVWRQLNIRAARRKILQRPSNRKQTSLAILDILEQTFHKNHPLSYEIEARAFGQLAVTPEAKSLLRLFSTQQNIVKLQDFPEPYSVNKIGIFGAGKRGRNILYPLACLQKAIRIQDLNRLALGQTMQYIYNRNSQRIEKSDMNQKDAQRCVARISPTSDWTGFRNIDFAIETTTDDLEQKRKVLHEIEERICSNGVMAINTHAFSLNDLCPQLLHSQRIIGWHFFHLAFQESLMEIIPTLTTNHKVIATALDLAVNLKKTPILVKDSPGFLVNRVLTIYLLEAVRMIEEGTPPEEIEEVMKSFGMMVGPYELIDELGIDVFVTMSHYLSEKFPYFLKLPKILHGFLADHRLGRKTGKGFYIYDHGQKELDSIYVYKVCKQYKNNKTTKHPTRGSIQIIHRLCYLLINEASKCLEEKIVPSAHHVNLGLVLGGGFPGFKGGPLSYANKKTIEKVYEVLNELALLFGHHFQPSAYIKSLVEKKQIFEC